MKHLFIALTALLIATPVFAQHDGVLTKIYFDTDKSDIRADEQDKLVAIGEQLKTGDFTVIIIGSADKRGKSLYNLRLADRRAKSVEAALKELGANGEIAFALSNGEERPSAPADDLPEHLQENRRVDVYVIAPEREVIEKTLTVEKIKVRRHRISGLLGAGPHTLDQTDRGTYIDVDWEFKPVGGLSYQFLTPLFNDRLSVGITGLSNATFTLGLGLDF
jgi:hypothetical protein